MGDHLSIWNILNFCPNLRLIILIKGCYYLLEFWLPTGAKFYSRDSFFLLFFFSGITSCPELRCVRNYVAFFYLFFLIFIYFFLNYIVSGITSHFIFFFIFYFYFFCLELHRVRNYVVSGITSHFFFIFYLFFLLLLFF